MDFSPACAEGIGNGNDLFKRFGIVLLEKEFDHPLQKAVMFAKWFDKAVTLRHRPCLCDVWPSLFHAPEAHQIHCGHKMYVDRTHGIQLWIHGQRQLRYGQGAVVVFLQIHFMRKHVARPQLHPIRQAGNVLLQININGHRQVQQHRGCRNRKCADGMQRRRGFPPEIVLQIRLHLFKGAHGLLNLPSGEAGKEPHKVG